MQLKHLLDEHGIPQVELAAGVGRSEALISRVVSGEAAPSKETIDRILAFLTRRLRRVVHYEECWGGAPAAVIE